MNIKFQKENSIEKIYKIDSSKQYFMKIPIKFLTTAVILTSCGVPQADYDNLKAENKQLKKRLLEKNTSAIKIIAPQNEVITEKYEEKNTFSYHSEAEALKLIKDYYNFYNADHVYRNPRVRRVNGNTFKISLEECSKYALNIEMMTDEERYQSNVYNLRINENGTYKVYL